MGWDWEELYRAAVLERDHKILASRIDFAQTVLRKRLQELWRSPEHHDDRLRIERAMRMLDLLRRTELKIVA